MWCKYIYLYYLLHIMQCLFNGTNLQWLPIACDWRKNGWTLNAKSLYVSRHWVVNVKLSLLISYILNKRPDSDVSSWCRMCYWILNCISGPVWLPSHPKGQIQTLFQCTFGYITAFLIAFSWASFHLMYLFLYSLASSFVQVFIEWSACSSSLCPS